MGSRFKANGNICAWCISIVKQYDLINNGTPTKTSPAPASETEEKKSATGSAGIMK